MENSGFLRGVADFLGSQCEQSVYWLVIYIFQTVYMFYNLMKPE